MMENGLYSMRMSNIIKIIDFILGHNNSILNDESFTHTHTHSHTLTHTHIHSHTLTHTHDAAMRAKMAPHISKHIYVGLEKHLLHNCTN